MAEDLNDVYKKYNLVGDASNAAAITFGKDNTIFVAFDHEWRLHYIVHETCHIVNRLYDNIGAEQVNLGGEPHAYLIEYVFDIVYNALNKLKPEI